MPWARLLAAVSLLASLLAAASPVRARHAMVVTREPHATEAGLNVLRAGGNAVDAAVAAGLALAVTHPSAGNIGGGGFMLIRFADGRATFLDFRERAPGKAGRDMYLDAGGKPTGESVLGWRACGVPGSLRGFEYASRKYGRKPWSDLVAPAVELAANGFPVSYGLASSLRASRNLSKFPESRRIFQRDGRYFERGETLVQPELARTLARVAKEGAKDFYEGETARILAREMASHGGLITLDDLKGYAVVERRPLEGDYRGYHIVGAPPPSAGGVGLLQMLGMLEGSGYEKAGAGSAAAIHYVAECMRRCYADRSEYLADPDYYDVPVKALLDRPYLAKRRESIDLEKATPSRSLRPGDFKSREGGETTHYSIVDAEGNAVAVTYTLNGGYGSGVAVPGLGALMNNEMDDFSAKPGAPNTSGLIYGEANAIQPGKRPLSSMTPTIVLRGGNLYMVLGTPGGLRIISNVLEVLLNVVDFRMNIQDAVNRPRFHHQWQPDKLYLEPGFSPDTEALLRARGHALERVGSMCEISAILVEGGWLQGAPDPRTERNALGY